MNLTITDADYKGFTYSGGERHVEILDAERCRGYEEITISKRIQSSDDLMDVLLLNEILRRWGFTTIHLVIPYVPYARQDRATTEETPRALKVFADIINSCDFSTVYVVDPHSIVAENLIDNMYQLDMTQYIAKFLTHLNWQEEIVFVSPDVGAIKKVEKYAKHFGYDMIVAHKDRDPKTGNIRAVKMLVDENADFSQKHLVVIDDICDGGRTFIELAKVLPACKSKSLFVTHGIFSQGLDLLFQAGYAYVGSTDSFKGKHQDDKRLVVIPIGP